MFNLIITPGLPAILFVGILLYGMTKHLSEPWRGIILSLATAIMIMGMIILAGYAGPGVVWAV